MFKFDIFKIDKKTQIALLMFILISFISGIFLYYEHLQNKTIIKKYPSNQVVSEVKEITVYICGEVKKPGVYNLQEGSRVRDAVAKAQGFTADADVNKINLAEKLYDEDRVYAPAKKKKTLKQSRKKTRKLKTKVYSNNVEKQSPKPLEDNDILMQEGIVEVKVNGRIKK